MRAAAVVMWYWRNGKYKVSLRSRSVDGRESFDCSALAKQFGGGGHRGAASFHCEELP
jgi:nanoRNase/pAp phosphatase (c-di-AMP/oligoRNAs hydrolase)